MPLDKIKKLIEYFDSGLIPTLAHHEVHPEIPLDSRENYLYFTLPVCINFQRSSPAMWASALQTYEDENTRYVFYPEKLANTPIEKIREDLVRHKLALQPNKHTLIWTTIGRTLHDHYADNPYNVLAEAEFDAGELINLLRVKHRVWFPYLSGPKLSNYWPYILLHYTSAKLKNSQEISIIPDTHVLQSSTLLGVTPAGSTSLQVEAAWKRLLKDSGISPVQVHPVLWNWSRNNFQPTV